MSHTHQGAESSRRNRPIVEKLANVNAHAGLRGFAVSCAMMQVNPWIWSHETLTKQLETLVEQFTTLLLMNGATTPVYVIRQSATTDRH